MKDKSMRDTSTPEVPTEPTSELAQVKAELDIVQQSMQAITEQRETDTKTILSTLQRLEASLTASQAQTAQAKQPEAAAPWRVTQNRARDLLLVLLGITAEAFFQIVIQEEVYPAIKTSIQKWMYQSDSGHGPSVNAVGRPSLPTGLSTTKEEAPTVMQESVDFIGLWSRRMLPDASRPLDTRNNLLPPQTLPDAPRPADAPNTFRPPVISPGQLLYTNTLPALGLPDTQNAFRELVQHGTLPPLWEGALREVMQSGILPPHFQSDTMQEDAPLGLTTGWPDLSVDSRPSHQRRRRARSRPKHRSPKKNLGAKPHKKKAKP